MSYTLEQYYTLKAAIAGGSKTVKYGDKEVEYRTLDEMLQILKLMEAELFPDTNGTAGQPSTRRVAAFSKGLG